MVFEIITQCINSLFISFILVRSNDPELRFMCLKNFNLLTKLETPSEYPYLKDTCGKIIILNFVNVIFIKYSIYSIFYLDTLLDFVKNEQDINDMVVFWTLDFLNQVDFQDKSVRLIWVQLAN